MKSRPLSSRIAPATFATLAALSLGITPAHAQISDNAVRIGVLADMSGAYSADGGPGFALGARMAVEDFGGQVNGKPIELLVADDQNKPDIGTGIARRWIEQDKVDTIVTTSASSIALSVNGLMKQYQKPYLLAGTGSSDLTGKACSPMNINFAFDTYMLPKGTVQALIGQGLKTFFFITVDYTVGTTMQAEAARFVEALGGKVVGSVKHPLGATDFSSYVLQAQASKAQVVMVLNFTSDTVNTLKAAGDFRLAKGGQVLAVPSMTANSVAAIGLDLAQGMQFTTPQYWDRNDENRAFSKRFMERHKGGVPTLTQATAYSAVTHYLKAVQATGSDEGPAVVARMKATPVNDFQMKNVPIREDGVVLRPTYLAKVKAPAESKSKYDNQIIGAEIPGEQIWRPLAEGGCDFVKAR
ncbi:MAG: ABC transporter substrate-binding protein [Pseudomonadota bacterium]